MPESFEFIGFEPSTHVVGQAVQRLKRIFGEAPSDSFTSAFVRKTREGFVGQLRVRSAVGTFVADVMGEDPGKVIDLLSVKIRTQLRLWKRRRHIL